MSDKHLIYISDDASPAVQSMLRKVFGDRLFIVMERPEDIYDYFGVCPQCGHCDGYLNDWFFCKVCRVKWRADANLFSSCKEQTEEEQRRIYDEIGLGDYREVKPR